MHPQYFSSTVPSSLSSQSIPYLHSNLSEQISTQELPLVQPSLPSNNFNTFPRTNNPHSVNATTSTLPKGDHSKISSPKRSCQATQSNNCASTDRNGQPNHRKELARKEGLVVIHVPFQAEEFDFTSTAKFLRYDPKRDQKRGRKSNRDSTRSIEKERNLSSPSSSSYKKKEQSGSRSKSSRRSSSGSELQSSGSRKSHSKNRPSSVRDRKSSDSSHYCGQTSSASDVKLTNNDKVLKSSPRVSFRVDKLIVESLDDVADTQKAHNINDSVNRSHNSKDLTSHQEYPKPILSRTSSLKYRNDRATKKCDGKVLQHRHSISTISPGRNLFETKISDNVQHSSNSNINDCAAIMWQGQEQCEFLPNVNTGQRVTLPRMTSEKFSHNEALSQYLSEEHDYFNMENSIVSFMTDNPSYSCKASSGDSSDTVSTFSDRTVVPNPRASNAIRERSANPYSSEEEKQFREFIRQNAIFSQNSTQDSPRFSSREPDSYVFQRPGQSETQNCNCSSGKNKVNREKPPIPKKTSKKILSQKNLQTKPILVERTQPTKKNTTPVTDQHKESNLIKPPVDFQEPCHDVYCSFNESPLSLRFEEILQHYDKISAGVFDSPRTFSLSENPTISYHGNKNSLSNSDRRIKEEQNGNSFQSLPMASSTHSGFAQVYSPRESHQPNLQNVHSLATLLSPKMCALAPCCEQNAGSQTTSLASFPLSFQNENNLHCSIEELSIKNFINLNHGQVFRHENNFLANLSPEVKNIKQDLNQFSRDSPNTDAGNFSNEENCDNIESVSQDNNLFRRDQSPNKKGLYYRRISKKGYLSQSPNYDRGCDCDTNLQNPQIKQPLSEILCPSCDSKSREHYRKAPNSFQREGQFMTNYGPQHLHFNLPGHLQSKYFLLFSPT